MPKKRQDKALLIKPGSQVHNPPPSQRNDGTPPSVNDLIRQSRRLQLTSEPTTASPLTVSVPPQLRSVLSLPAPQPPDPRVGTRPSGPARQRRIPGPPPPRSWLIDSRHAPPTENQDGDNGCRLHTRESIIPGAAFPSQESLLHVALKEIAVNWQWHAEYDGPYLGLLPTPLKECLLSYIAVYGESIYTNPLRLLFLADEDIGLRDEASRLDLTGGIGTWTSLRSLSKDLTARLPVQSGSSHPTVPASWDEADVQQSIPPKLNSRMTFTNLKHLSLALSPGKTASWQDLIHLTNELSTITSLSLAYWPQPTYTPRAASTRAVVKQSPGMPGVVYGGSNIYSSLDNDWREAAGILRTLSRSLYCLKWLDLTGCGAWFDALKWESDMDTAGPEWNGSWRNIENICLDVGWKPIAPQLNSHSTDDNDARGWDISDERRKYYHWKEVERHTQMSKSAEAVKQHLRGIRRRGGGKWISFEL